MTTSASYSLVCRIFSCLGGVALFLIAVSIAGLQIAHAAPSFTRFDTGHPLPVLAGGGPGAWDEYLREKVWVIHDNGIYKMWYTGFSQSGWEPASKIGYATSTDGINWVKYGGNPVINRSSQDQDICVVKAGDGTYYMYVEVNDQVVDLMTSADGINWIPYAGNPVKLAAASPLVWREGNAWYMLYEHMVGPVFNIHLATSSDGMVWTDSPSNPVLSESTHTVPDSIVKEGSVYHFYYHRSVDDWSWPTWLATSQNLTTWTNRQLLYERFSSQTTLVAPDGRILAYVWNLNSDNKYYLRYGLEPASPTAWYLDEGSGPIAADASGNGATGVLFNGATWATGVRGSAIDFNGVNGFVQTGYYASPSTWTAAAWVRSPAAPTTAPSAGPLHRATVFEFDWNHHDWDFQGAVVVRVGGVWYPAKFGPLAGNTWYHLAATYDGETLRAYRNGVLVTANTAPSGPPDRMEETTPLMLGRHCCASQFFAGTVDDVRIYHRVLSNAEITALAQSDPTPPGSAVLTASLSGQAALLAWTTAVDPESGVSRYRIYRDTLSGTAKSLLTEVGASPQTYLDSSTTPSTTYFYEVSAVNGAGLEGPRSNEVNVLTGNTSPLLPAGLVARAGDGRVDLDWSDNSEADLAGYHVYRALVAGGPYTRLTVNALTVSAYTDTSLVNGATYYYVVTAVDTAAGESGPSLEASAVPAAVDTSIAVYWPLDEGAGMTTVDASGHGFAGTLIGGPAWIPGQIGNAISFDGVDDYVQTGFTTQLPTWTVATWVRGAAAPAAAGASGPVHRNLSFQLNWNHTVQKFRGAAALRVGGQWRWASFGTLSGNVWYHLAATYDGATLKTYRNGALVSIHTGPSGPPDVETAPLAIGRHSGAPQFFAGAVDDVRVYPRALSDAEIAALAGAP